MTSRDFVYWLQGFFELNEAHHGGEVKIIQAQQYDLIKRHLALVFVHEIDPSMGGAEHQAKLNEIHDAAKAAQKTADEAKKAAAHANGPVVYRC